MGRKKQHCQRIYFVSRFNPNRWINYKLPYVGKKVHPEEAEKIIQTMDKKPFILPEIQTETKDIEVFSSNDLLDNDEPFFSFEMNDDSLQFVF